MMTEQPQLYKPYLTIEEYSLFINKLCIGSKMKENNFSIGTIKLSGTAF